MSEENQRKKSEEFGEEIDLESDGKVNRNDTTSNADTIEAANDNNEDDGKPKTDLEYNIDDVPPWFMCIFLGLQVGYRSR